MSLRTLELDARREVGILSKDPQSREGAIAELFEADWIERPTWGRRRLKVR